MLGGGYSQAIYMANVRNPRLVESFKAALLALPGVTLHEQCEVNGFILDEGNVVGVSTTE